MGVAALGGRWWLWVGLNAGRPHTWWCGASTCFLCVVRRCPTLPHPHECSTIGAVGLSFRVRNGTGRFPHAMTTVTRSPNQRCFLVGWLVGCSCYGTTSILLYKTFTFPEYQSWLPMNWSTGGGVLFCFRATFRVGLLVGNHIVNASMLL